MGQKIVHLLAFFSLIYVGAEVTIGGWTITYIIRQRGGGPSSGYISTGFFGGKKSHYALSEWKFDHLVGLTLGRVALLWLNKKVVSLSY